MKSMKLTLAMVAAVALASVPLSGWAYAFESSALFATWTDGAYDVENDVWGSNPGPQTVWANSYSNWGVFSTQSGGGIKSYPNCDYANINIAVNSLSCSSSFNASTPGGADYDQSYDIWCNGSGYEIMIWNSWNGNQPVAQSYNASGQANPTYSNVSIGGTTYNVYTGTGGSGPCMSFLRTSQTSSGTVNIAQLLQWINTTGWYNNPTLSKVQCGWEILSTGGSQETFTMNSYSVTVGSGGGSGCTPTAITPYVQVNSGSWSETTSASVAAGGTVSLGPQPVSGGSWSWSGPNGYSSTSRQITISDIQSSQGGTYVATYTNPGGCNSTESFSITVTGGSGCTPTAITPYVQINSGSWVETTSATVAAGGTVSFGPQPVSGGSWSWKGPNGYSSTARQITISNVQSAETGTYTATYTNSSGCQSTENFTLAL
jgi:hypothetical protein